MEINNLSSRYIVRYLKEEDIKEIYILASANPTYYQYRPPEPSYQSIRNDMRLTPTSKTLADKYYLGFYDNDKLMAILDLIDNYPVNNCAFIGFFMLDKAYQHQGIASFIVKELTTYLASCAYDKIKLAWVKDNKEAGNFWQKNGFQLINERDDLIIAEMKLRV